MADNNKIKLALPAEEHRAEALSYKKEFTELGESHIHGSGSLGNTADYGVWLKKVAAARTTAQPGWVTATTYFAITGKKIVGTIQIRHTLNDMLLETGGHIGYGVRPSERRKGYATQMLALALGKCRGLGIERALVTCNTDNVGSARTIQKNGGVLENEVYEDNGKPVQRYWIDIK